MATTLSNIYDIQTAIESGSAAIVRNRCGIPNVYTSRSDSDRATPSVEISFDLGNPLGSTIISGSKVLYNSWNGTTKVMVVTNRVEMPASHSAYISSIRNNLSDPSNYNTASVLPYHYVIKSSNEQTANNTEDNLDMTIMTFSQIVYVRPDAW